MSTARVQIRCPIYGQCKLCGQVVAGWIGLNSDAQIIDSAGLVVCSDGIACDPCLGGAAERGTIVERLKNRAITERPSTECPVKNINASERIPH